MIAAVEPLSPVRRSQSPRVSALGWRLERALQALEEAASPPVPVPARDAPVYWGRLLLRFPPLEELLICRQDQNDGVLAEMTRADPALLPRAERLRDGDAELFGEFLELWALTRGLHKGVQAERLRELRERVLAWIARCRTHEREITRGLQEAHLRDRGVAG